MQLDLPFLRCVLKIRCLDFGFIFEDNRRTSERRAELARAIPSEEEEDVVKLEVKEGA